ncbi:MAG: PIN domain-containing protein [Bryobacteraceae bacterium]|jgi:predicted nucleic acid-binding protein
MRVLVDTCIWSLAFRRRSANPGAVSVLVRELEELIREDRAQLIGPVRQELLSAISDQKQYESLRRLIRAFADEPIRLADSERAARIANECRRNGIAASAVDALICAVAIERSWSVFTSDRDFARYAEILPVSLHSPRRGSPPA